MEGGIVLYKLRYPKEIRKMNEVPQVDGQKVDKGQLKLARNLVDSMSTSYKKLELTDTYHEALVEMIEAKVAGKEVVTVEEEPKPVVDIMSALKQSIEQAKSHRKPMEKATGKKKVPEAKTTKVRKAKAG
jgi:DNA end-binding protein Ku